MASGGAGKAVAGCSCLSMVFFLVTILFLQFGMVFVMEAMPEQAVVLGSISGIGGMVSNICCCLSGFGMIVGIIMLVMSKDDE